MLRDDRAPRAHAASAGCVALRIGSLAIDIDADAELSAALLDRYGAFEGSGPEEAATCRVRIDARSNEVSTNPGAPLGLHTARLEELEGGLLEIAGDFRAAFDPATRRGDLERGEGTIGVDMLLRLALSLCALEDGWVLLHGAAVELRSGGWAVLVGESGAGKSTAARQFASRCDELVLARAGNDGAEAGSTPYWRGEPGRAVCEAIVWLDRSPIPAMDVLRGSHAARAVLRHAVRFVRNPVAASLLIANVRNLAARVSVLHALAPRGPGFVPWLESELGRQGFPPRRRSEPRT